MTTRSLCVRLLAFCACALLAFPAAALEPRLTLTQYVRDVWRTDQGLPQDRILAVVQTADGYLWLATEEGLVRFDGVQFTVFDKSNTAAFDTNAMIRLLAAKDGRLFVGTDRGVFVYQRGSFSRLNLSPSGATSEISAFHQSPDGTIWIGSRGALTRLRQGTLLTYTSADGLPDAVITSIAEDRWGRLWVGTEAGLAKLEFGQLSAVPLQAQPNPPIQSLLWGRDDELWIGTSGAGLLRLRGANMDSFRSMEALSSATVTALYEDRSGSLWVGTAGAGILRRAGGRFESFSASGDAVSSFWEDREGNLWIGTAHGLNRLKEGSFTTFAAREGVRSESVRTILGDLQGNVWIGGPAGLIRLYSGTSSLLTKADGLSSDRVLSLWRSRDGALWVGTLDAGLNRIANGKISSYTTRDGLSSDAVLSIYEDRDGSMWVGTARGLDRLVDGKPSPLIAKGRFSGQVISVIHQDRDANLWIGTQDGGLNRIGPAGVTVFGTKDGLLSESVVSIHEDDDGTLWFGTAGGGVARYKQGKFASITSKDGLFDDNVFVILEDHGGNLWMSCNKGIFRVSKRELNAFADKRARAIRSVSYGIADGMKSRECNGGTQPAGWRMADGKLWFATTAGAAVVDPDQLKINAVAPPVVLEQMRNGHQTVDLRGGAPELPAGSSSLEFRYTGLSFVAPEKVRFNYKLEGFDRNWIDAGTRRVAYYTNIPPGTYQFKVMAANDEGVWSRSAATVGFRLKPHFYQTHWFALLVVLGVIAAAWSLHQSRVRLVRASAERFRLLFERNLAGVFRTTLEGRMLACNDACARILGYGSCDELIASGISDGPQHEMLLARLKRHGTLTNVEINVRRNDGSAVWVLENVSLVKGAKGEPPSVIEGTLLDITDRKKFEEQIEYQAYHDALTALPNRALFKDRLTVALAHARRTAKPLAVMFLDLDGFKLINDTLGHTVGDGLLCDVAERLKTCLREEDSVARIGGDEFTLLLTDLRSVEDTAGVAQKILETVAKSFIVDQSQLYLTASIGIALYPADGEDVETLLKNADNAMYRAKDVGGNNYQLCTPAMTQRAADRLSLENALRKAIEAEQFVIHYQPQMSLATGSLTGVEALLRWKRPGSGLVLPAEFISVAEDSRLIIAMGEWALRRACLEVKKCQETGFPALRVAVNLSARQFQQRHLLKSIQQAIEGADLDPRLLDLEITESTAMQNPELTAATLRDLKEMGVRVTIDDFGTGHSSLDYLKRFPIDALKIDRSFVSNVPADSSDAAIIAAVLAMAGALRMTVIAEGVETYEQLEFLRERGCDEVQGFLLSEPVPVEELTQVLRLLTVPSEPLARRPRKMLVSAPRSM